MPQHLDVRTVTVPGCVDGWLALHDRFGRLPLADVLAPAIAYADDGFPASPLLVGVGGPARRPAATGARAGTRCAAQARRAGDLVRRPGAARALRAIAAEGRDGFYGGEFGAGLVALGGGEYTDGRPGHGRWPTGSSRSASTAWGHRLWTMPPASQGYLTLAGGVDRRRAGRSPTTPTTRCGPTSSSRRPSPPATTASTSSCDGADGRGPARARAPRPAARRHPPPTAAERRGRRRPAPATRPTCAPSTATAWACRSSSRTRRGSAAACSSRTPASTSTTAASASRSCAGHPAEYGPGPAAAPHAVRRRSSPRPTAGWRAVLGTQGGDGQPQILLQVLARLLHAGQSPAEAIGSPRWVLAGTGQGFDTWSAPSRSPWRSRPTRPAAWFERSGRARPRRRHAPTAVRATSSATPTLIVADADGVLAGAADPRRSRRSGAARRPLRRPFTSCSRPSSGRPGAGVPFGDARRHELLRHRADARRRRPERRPDVPAVRQRRRARLLREHAPLGPDGRRPRLRHDVAHRAPLPVRGLRGAAEPHPVRRARRRPHRAPALRPDVQRRAAVAPAAPGRGLRARRHPHRRPHGVRRRAAAPCRARREPSAPSWPRATTRCRPSTTASTARRSRRRWRSSSWRGRNERFSFRGKHFVLPARRRPRPRHVRQRPHAHPQARPARSTSTSR